MFGQLAEWGLEDIGDYGSFIFLGAMAKLQHRIGRSSSSRNSSSMGGGEAAGSSEAGDDGSALVAALTKCDVDSWCHEINAFNATMTIESLTKSPFAEGQVTPESVSQPGRHVYTRRIIPTQFDSVLCCAPCSLVLIRP